MWKSRAHAAHRVPLTLYLKGLRYACFAARWEVMAASVGKDRWHVGHKNSEAAEEDSARATLADEGGNVARRCRRTHDLHALGRSKKAWNQAAGASRGGGRSQ